MKFRLYYDGPLQPSQPPGNKLTEKAVSKARHKHHIRTRFHKQLSELWATHPVLTNLKVCEKCGPFHHAPSQPQFGGLLGSHQYIHVSDYEGTLQQKFGFSFFPLVTQDFGTYASLDVLFLRRDGPGSVISAGDIDNRMKTLIDALKMPGSPNEVHGLAPKQNETPFYCLLEDDALVSGFNVETDRLLRPMRSHDENQFAAKVVISVEIKPYNVTTFNQAFV